MRNIRAITNLLRNKEFTTKIAIYMSTKTYGDDYSPYEENFSYSNLNPLTIKGFVSQLSPTALVWRQYGLKEQGSLEVICESRYKNWFKNCNKVVVNGDEYEVFHEAVGDRAIITDRPYNLIRVILFQKT